MYRYVLVHIYRIQYFRDNIFLEFDIPKVEHIFETFSCLFADSIKSFFEIHHNKNVVLQRVFLIFNYRNFLKQRFSKKKLYEK